MIKGILAIDENGGISKGKSMPWPKKNSRTSEHIQIESYG